MIYFSLVQSKHFLVETEDNSAERFRADDYADDNTLTDKGSWEGISIHSIPIIWCKFTT